MSCVTDFVQYVSERGYDFPLLRRIALHLFDDAAAHPVLLSEVMGLSNASLAHLAACIARLPDAGDWQVERATSKHLNEMMVGLRDGIVAETALILTRRSGAYGAGSVDSGADSAVESIAPSISANVSAEIRGFPTSCEQTIAISR